MDMKKWLCLVVAMLMALSAVAMAETANGADLQAQLDVANARIAVLEAMIEKYQPVYESQVVAEYGEDGVIWLKDAQAQYEAFAAQVAQMGMSIDTIADRVKPSILESLVREAVVDGKAKELGLADLSEETLAELRALAEEDLETYINYNRSYFVKEEMSDEEAREVTVQGLADNGITVDALLEHRVDAYVDEQLHNYVTKDVAIDEADVQAEYEKMIEADQKDYTDNDDAYIRALNGNATIAWNPEGYRGVKHVLVKFNDEQSAKYRELNSSLNSLQSELDALDAPADDAEAAEPEAGEDEAEAPRSREEIQTEMREVGVAIEALYSELMPRAQEVIDAFNAGTDFDELIAQYGEDPGMTTEPNASRGYAVSANSTAYDDAFTQGAMSIAEPGQISDMVRSSFGIHIIYYLNDITPGTVPLESIREAVETDALADKISQTFEDQVQVWMTEANVVYHPERF